MSNDTTQQPVSLPEYVAHAIAIHPCEHRDIERVVRDTIKVMALLAMEGKAVELPGYGTIEVGTRPNRKVKKNMDGPDGETYDTGPRACLRLKPTERFQKKLSVMHRVRQGLIGSGRNNDAKA